MVLLKLRTLLTPENFWTVFTNWSRPRNRERIIHWGPRTLDLDILFYDNEIIDLRIFMFHILIWKIVILS